MLVVIALTACASASSDRDVPDFVVQHSLSSLTSDESFSFEQESGRVLVISPLGTFKSGDYYCRDYEISYGAFGAKPVKRTACRFDNHWTDVDPSKLDL